MKIPKKLLNTKERREMWRDASRIIGKLEKEFGFSEIYAIGSFISNKKRPSDIDFTVVAKMKNNVKFNKKCAWPIDIVIVPENSDTEYHLRDIKTWMKRRYGSSSNPMRIK